MNSVQDNSIKSNYNLCDVIRNAVSNLDFPLQCEFLSVYHPLMGNDRLAAAIEQAKESAGDDVVALAKYLAEQAKAKKAKLAESAPRLTGPRRIPDGRSPLPEPEQAPVQTPPALHPVPVTPEPVLGQILGAPDPNLSKSDDVTQDTQDIQRLRIRKETQETQDSHGLSSGGERTKEQLPEPAPEVRNKCGKQRSAWYHQFLSRPFHQVISDACRYQYDHLADGEEWNSPIFHFVWLVWSHKDLWPYRYKPADALKFVEPYLKEWSRREKKSKQTLYEFTGDCWHDWFGVSKEDARAEFMDLWGKLRYRAGENPLDQAIEVAKRMRLLLRDDVAAKRLVDKLDRGTNYEFFVSVIGHLQVAVGGGPIQLPCHQLGYKMGVSPMTISRWRRWAIEDGYITQTKAARFNSKGPGDATEFTAAAVVRVYSVLKERAVPTDGEYAEG